jgi:hypothetical protein
MGRNRSKTERKTLRVMVTSIGRSATRGYATRTGLHTLDCAGRRRIAEWRVDRVLISHETVEIRYTISLTEVHLLYLSTSFLWWHTVADIIGAKSSNVRRMHAPCT